MPCGNSLRTVVAYNTNRAPCGGSQMENSKTVVALSIALLVLHVSIDFAVLAAEGDCGVSEYLDSQGVCKSCHGRTCEAGERITTNCGNGQDVTCERCTDLEPGHTCASGISSRTCISCESQNKKQVQECNAKSDRICEGCLDNHYPTVSADRVYCIHCWEDKQNRSECRHWPEPPIIQTPGEDNDGPQLPGAETTKEKDTKSQDVSMLVLITALSSFAIGFLALLGVWIFWKKFKTYRGRPYQQAAHEDVESPRPEESEGRDGIPEEEDAMCRIEGSKKVGKQVRFKRQLSSSSTKSEDEEKLLDHTSTAKSKYRPPNTRSWNSCSELKLKRSSGVSEVDVHCAGSPSAHGVDAAPFPKDGTPSPFPVEEEALFPHPAEITEAAEQRHEPEAENPVPGTNMRHTRREFKDLSGQTAKFHSANTAPNNTANTYHTNLALCSKHGDSIRLDDEWFNYNIQQKLSVYLDKNQPIPSMPTWRTYFETFKLTKNELDAVDNKAVPSPTIALFDALQRSNPGAENCFTVGDVLRQLDRMKFTDAANALCHELLEHIEQTKA